MAFYIDVQGKNRIRKTLRSINEQSITTLDRQLRKAGMLVRDDARSLAPPGKIKRGIDLALVNAGTYDVTVLVGLPKRIFYGHMVEFGTSQHAIEPKKGKALSWTPKGQVAVFTNKKGKAVRKKVYALRDGNYTFDQNEARITVKSVEHPGGRPRPFLFPAYNKNKQKAKDLIAEGLSWVFKKAVQEAGNSD